MGVFLMARTIVDRHGERLVAGLLAEDDLDQHHPVDRREEVQADEVLGSRRGFRQGGDGNGGGVGGEYGVGLQRRLSLLDRRRLDDGVLEHRFDHQIAALERRVVGSRRNQRQKLLVVVRLRPPLLHLLGDQALGIRLALVGRRLVAVDQHDRDAGFGGHIGDAGAHEAGAQHADLAEFGLGHASRPSRALVELLQGDEKGADHRRRLARLQDFREVALLDPESGVERHQQALVNAFEDRRGRRIVAVGLAAQDGDGRRPEIGALCGVDRETRQPEALFVPGLHGLQAVADHRLRRLHELRRLGDRMKKAHRLGLLRRQRLPGRQHLQRFLGLSQAGHPLGAAGAGEDADLHLGKRDPHIFRVGGNPTVTGQRQLEGAAHAGAVDRGNPRLAAGLQLAEQPGHAADGVEQEAHRLVLVPGLLRLETFQHAAQHGEVGAAGEAFLAGGQDGSLDRRVGGDLVDDPVELLEHAFVEDVHRSIGHVPGHERDPVAVGHDGEILIAHRNSSPWPADAPGIRPAR